MWKGETNMKNLKLILITGFTTAFLVGASIPTSIAMSRAINANTPSTLSSDIIATKPGRGETVSFLPEALSRFWNLDNLMENYPQKAHEISELTPYSSELASWQNYLGDSESQKAALRAIFDKYDIFRPTNNVLAWDSKISAKNYRVIISQDRTFANIEREYTVSGSTKSVIFENPYSGTNYYWQVIATKNDDSLVYSDIFNFSTANLPRTVNIEGVSNTRDLGGNVGLNGKRMKEGLLYRGMRLEAITTGGENEFKNNLGIKAEVDLRSVNEGTENYLNLSKYYHYSSPYDYSESTALDYAINGPLAANFGNAIKVFANPSNYPAFFHCSVGRDRTGWMGICLNLLCGVSEEVTLKEFCLSSFSTSGALNKGNTGLYDRYIRFHNYLNNLSGSNMSEKMETYLTTICGVTHEECANIRGILLGDIDTGFVPGTVNPNPYTNLAKVTFKNPDGTSIIKMVEIGSLLEEPSISGDGAWYHGNDVWDFAHDVVTGDMCLVYIVTSNYKVIVHYSGIDLDDEIIEAEPHSHLDFARFNRDGYTFKVYNDAYTEINELVVESDVSINVVYKSTQGYIPKANSRIIIMAGQSNAGGVGHFHYLEDSLDEDKLDEIINGYDNVLVTGYSNADITGDIYADVDGFNGFRKINASRYTNTSGTIGTFGFEVGLADRLSKVFPDETTYIVKYAYGGSSLNFDWISPSSYSVPVVSGLDTGYERGWLYTGLVASLTSAIKAISESTNTTPMVDALMWMQGESDAVFSESLAAYLSSFNNWMNDFTNTFRDNLSHNFALYDAAICETAEWKYPSEINAIKRSRVDENNIYLETNERITTSFEPIGSGTDIHHYDAACYIDLGHMFADAYLTKTLNGYSPKVLEIEPLTKIVLHQGETIAVPVPVVTLDGVEVDAKLTYRAQQYKSNNDVVYSYFKVNKNGTITASSTRTGVTKLRITAYYQDEVRTILIPLEVVA